MMFMLIVCSHAATIELEWVCKNDGNISEYSISYGKINGALSVTTKVGKISSYKIDTLSEGESYWFRITPILASGGSGNPSNVITYKVPSRRVDDTHSTPQLRLKSSEKKSS